MASLARAYRQLVTLTCALLCWWAPAYVWASLSHRATLPFPDRAQHAAQQGLAATQGDRHLTSNPNPTRRVGARDVGKAAAVRRWVGAPPYDGQVTRYAYDDQSALREVTYPNGAAYSFTHDERGRLMRVAGPQGEIATYEYDLRHNLIRETDPKGEATTYTYNAMGLPLSATDALGRTTRVTYDALGRRVQVDLPDRTSRTFVYDGASRLVSSTNGNGEVTWMVYKGINALQEVNLANGQAYRFKYNANEKLLQVANLVGDVHKYIRDLAGRVVRMIAGVIRCTSTTPQVVCSNRGSSVSWRRSCTTRRRRS